MQLKAKKASESLTVMTEVILPNDTNPLNNLFGGQLLAWMDRASGVAAKRHSHQYVVTASINNVSFNQPIPMGSVITIEAKVSRAFKSSMEIYVDVWVEDMQNARSKVNEAIYTFVAVDKVGNPVEVPNVIPETEIEKERYEGALRRKELSLILAGKLDPSKATELKNLFA